MSAFPPFGRAEPVVEQRMEDAENLSPVTSAKGVGDAVGIPGRQWYVAFVGQNTEKSCREKLQRLGYDCYVATQDEIHQWRNGRRHHVERVVISTIVFVHATEDERRDIVNLPFIKYFMTDKALSPTTSASIPSPSSPTRRCRSSASCSTMPTSP